MKKSINSILLTSMACFLFITGCENFLDNRNVKNQLEDEINYANAESVSVTVAPADTSHGQVSDSITSVKLGYPYEISFEKESEDNFIFDRWAAYIYYGTENQQELSDAYAVFSNPADPKKCTVTILKSIETNVRIVPVCHAWPTCDLVVAPESNLHGTVTMSTNSVKIDTPFTVGFEIDSSEYHFSGWQAFSNYKTDGQNTPLAASIVEFSNNQNPAYCDVTVHQKVEGLRIIPVCSAIPSCTLNVAPESDAQGKVTSAPSVVKLGSTYTYSLTFKLNSDDYIFKEWKAYSNYGSENQTELDETYVTFSDSTNASYCVISVLKSASNLYIVPVCSAIPSCTLNVAPESDAQGKVTSAPSVVKLGSTYTYSLTFKLNSDDYIFKEWKAYSNYGSENQTELDETYVTFSDSTNASYCVISVLKSASNLYIVPECIAFPKVTFSAGTGCSVNYAGAQKMTPGSYITLVVSCSESYAFDCFGKATTKKIGTVVFYKKDGTPATEEEKNAIFEIDTENAQTPADLSSSTFKIRIKENSDVTLSDGWSVKFTPVIRPSLSYTIPSPNEKDVYRTTPLKLYFSKPMEESTFAPKRDGQKNIIGYGNVAIYILNSPVEELSEEKVMTTKYFSSPTLTEGNKCLGYFVLASDTKTWVPPNSFVLVKISGSVMDADGIPLGSDYKLLYQVGTVGDNKGPSIKDAEFKLKEHTGSQEKSVTTSAWTDDSDKSSIITDSVTDGRWAFTVKFTADDSNTGTAGVEVLTVTERLMFADAGQILKAPNGNTYTVPAGGLQIFAYGYSNTKISYNNNYIDDINKNSGTDFNRSCFEKEKLVSIDYNSKNFDYEYALPYNGIHQFELGAYDVIKNYTDKDKAEYYYAYRNYTPPRVTGITRAAGYKEDPYNPNDYNVKLSWNEPDDDFFKHVEITCAYKTGTEVHQETPFTINRGTTSCYLTADGRNTSYTYTVVSVDKFENRVEATDTYYPGFVKVNGATVSGAVSSSKVFTGGSVKIRNMYVCDHEVTQEEYETYCFYGGSTESGYLMAPSDKPPMEFGNYGIGDNYPAYYVNWYDALVYCNLRSIAEGLTPVYSIDGKTNPADWKDRSVKNSKYCGPSESSKTNSTWDKVSMDSSANGYRLPTEAEWEYTARSGKNGILETYPYSGSSNPDNVAWYYGISDGIAHEVRNKNANTLGIYDMSGNAAEWCWDLSPGAETSRITRGGNFREGGRTCSVYERGSEQQYRRRYPHIGFRVVRNAN